MTRRRGAASSFVGTPTKSWKGKKCYRCGKVWKHATRPSSVDAAGNYWCRDCRYYKPQEEAK